jgi:hypothetical protein
LFSGLFADVPPLRLSPAMPESYRLLKLDSETPDGKSLDYPRLRAAQTVKLNFLVDIPQDKFREVSEAMHPK